MGEEGKVIKCVWEERGARVVDLSCLSTVPSANPHMPLLHSTYLGIRAQLEGCAGPPAECSVTKDTPLVYVFLGPEGAQGQGLRVDAGCTDKGRR